MTYSEKLRDPRWQKRRLEIMQEANFSCSYCNDKETMLVVHHMYYEFNNDPWDYPDHGLICLCDDCHSFGHNTTIPQSIKDCFEYFYCRGLYAKAKETVIAALNKYGRNKYGK